MPASTSSSHLHIGLMSGTSVDSIDAVLVDFAGPTPRVRTHIDYPIPAALRRDLLTLSQPGEDHLDLLGRCDRAVGQLFADAALKLMDAADISADQVAAIGSHGQTVRHRPPQAGEDHPFSLQIGDPNIIAATTGITTAADFRRRDMALGGQGAPLAPAFHRAVFSDAIRNRAVVNLGGIANITWLPADGPAFGFDTGPANMLMDGWAQRHLGQAFDHNGDWAAGGSVQLELLKRLLQHPFLALPAPKSTGREEFNLNWLDRVLSELGSELKPQDVQATLLEFTARSAADAIKGCGTPSEVYLCGGGALNGQLIARFEALLHPAQVASTASLGLDPKLVEGVAFAWLAKQTLARLPGNLPTATGASDEVILGGVYFS